MKRILYLLLIISIVSCVTNSKNMNITKGNIDKIEVFKGFPGAKVEMTQGFEEKLIQDLNNSINNGPTKYAKSHRILIYHTNGTIDTIKTNGTIHNYKGWFKSKEDLIKKYSR